MLVCQVRAFRALRDAGCAVTAITYASGHCDGSEIFISRIDGTTKRTERPLRGKINLSRNAKNGFYVDENGGKNRGQGTCIFVDSDWMGTVLVLFCLLFLLFSVVVSLSPCYLNVHGTSSEEGGFLPMMIRTYRT